MAEWRHKKGVFAGVVLALVVTAGVFLFLRVSGGFGAVRENISQFVFARVIRAVRRVSRGVFHRQSAYEALEDERRRLLGEQAALTRLREENGALRRALALQSDLRRDVVPASVVGFSREIGHEVIIIDAGRAAGIQAGDIVVADGSIYTGRVRGVSESSAEVFLPTSADETFSILFTAGTIRARSRGVGGGELAVDLVPEEAPVAKGDLFFVVLPDAVWAGPLLLGEVRAVTLDETSVFKAIRALHLFDPWTADRVFVIRAAE